MAWLARLFSAPERQLKVAAECLQKGRLARAAKATDLASGILQRRLRARLVDATKALLADAWFLRGQIHLKERNSPNAFRCFFACLDRVAEDVGCLSFVVREAVN